jgi:hypothetical protein
LQLTCRQVLSRLTTIQQLIASFNDDYQRQTDLLLGEASGLDGGSSFDNAFQQIGFNPIKEEKKERKKRTHDPNAPKRPLTPYFLYMQTARPIIASDLGEDAAKGAVQEEGQRRWAAMSPQEKQGWNQAYQYNLRLYNARQHSYKHGNPLARDMSDDDALKYAEDYNIEMPGVKGIDDAPGNEQDAIAEQLGQLAAAPAIEEEEEIAPPPTAKTPKKAAKAGGKRKTGTPGETAEVAKSPVAANPLSPAQKRKRASTKPEDAAEPKKAGRGKKAKTG